MVDGSQWLLEDEDSWPRPTKMKETRKPAVLVSHRHSIPIFPPTDETIEEWRLNSHRYSSWMHLVAIHVRVLRVLCNMRKKEKRVHGDDALHPEEIRDAEEDLIRRVQIEAFPEKYQALKTKRAISPKSRLTKLSSRIDQGWKMYRTTGPLVPENFWGCQKIF